MARPANPPKCDYCARVWERAKTCGGCGASRKQKLPDSDGYIRMSFKEFFESYGLDLPEPTPTPSNGRIIKS